MADEYPPVHFAFPFMRDTTGHIAVNAQDSPDDIADCVEASLMTPAGWRVDAPLFGISDPTFAAPVNIEQLMAEIERDEPRAHPILQEVDTNEGMTRDEFLTNLRMAL